MRFEKKVCEKKVRDDFGFSRTLDTGKRRGGPPYTRPILDLFETPVLSVNSFFSYFKMFSPQAPFADILGTRNIVAAQVNRRRVVRNVIRSLF